LADAKISALNALTTADDADLFAVVDTSATETKKITKANMLSPIVVSGANVGIGITPSAKLHVNGDSEINGLTIGRGAGNNVNNTAVGYNALVNNSTAANNTAVGVNALLNNTTGGFNTAVGNSPLLNNTTASYNTAVGNGALLNNTTANFNTAVGVDGLLNNTTGSSNTATGLQSLYSNTTGNFNVSAGLQSLYSNTTGGNNTATGREALRNNSTGANNVAYGALSLYSNTTGGGNTAYGVTAGYIITTGNRNVIIGEGSDSSAEDGDDQIVVGYSLTGKGNDTAYVGGTNGAYNEKNVTTWETTSDERIKKNIEDNNTGLDILSQIQVRNFEYRTPDEITNLPSHAAIKKDGVQLGVIAQEIQKVLPECVSENSTGVLSVNTDPLVWYLINAVKELKAEIQALKGS
jgi:trimeric autotransporter adhesin